MSDDVLWPAQWRLARLEVVNWGTFSGHHAIDVAREGHLITGASGSGKSSLLDAIAAVLTPDKWLRLNAAAQDLGSGRSDRTLVSYVRGAWSKEADEREDRTVASYLRPGATWSGILLRFDDGTSAPVTLVRLFHLRGTGTDMKALNDACLILREHTDLDGFHDYAARGIDARRLKTDLEPVVVTTNRSHGAFYVRLRSLLGIGSENALHLLHKTQSAKNLGTLDRLFRDFMLDEPVTFERARNAVEQFGELDDAYRHVVDLREQAEVLRAASTAADDYELASGETQEAVRMRDLVVPYAESRKRELVTDELHDAKVRTVTAQQAYEQARAASDEAREAWDAARRISEQVGGADANQLGARIADVEARAVEVREARARFDARLESSYIAKPAGADDFAELVVMAERELAEPAPEPVRHEVQEALSIAKHAVTHLQEEIAELRHRRSNISGDLLRIRAKLAADLRIPESAIPFGGELLDVRPEFAEWTGAIERVLAPLSRALLVGDDVLPAVRRLVDAWHLGTRLVIEAVPAEPAAPARPTDPRSVVRRVDVAPGRFASFLNWRISAEFDVACVDSPDELDAVSRGITRTGLLKKSERRFEKSDRTRVDDRATWVLGSSNDAKLDHLMERLSEAQRVRDARQRDFDEADAQRQVVLDRRRVLEEVVATKFASIDPDATERHLARLRAERSALVRPDSDLARALEAQRDAHASYLALDERAGEARKSESAAEADEQRLRRLLDELRRDGGDAIDGADAQKLLERFAAVRRSLRVDTIDSVATQVATTLAREAEASEKRVRSATAAFSERATRYQAKWPSQSADLTAGIDDRDGYRARLEAIVANGLPEHESRFLRLLRERSRDTLIHLRDEIMSAPRRVEERVEPVNESLGRSPFDAGTHLAIQVKLRRTGEVEEFLKELGAVVDGAFAEESVAQAEKRFTVLRRMMIRLGSSDSPDLAWRSRVLDTREHVTFLARELADDGRVVMVHDPSAGLSGGQRQKLVVFCLAAALRYQLTERDEEMPRYGTIVLDEAFDKADAQYTRMALDIFREFGFHMVLATPQKLLQTLEPYIGAVTSVANPERAASSLAHVAFERAGS